MSGVEKEHIIAAFSFELAKVNRPEIRTRTVNEMLARIDGGLARAVAANLGLPAPAVAPANGTAPRKPDVEATAPVGGKHARNGAHPTASPILSQLNPETGVQGDITGRKVAILVAAGASTADVLAIDEALQAAGAESLVLAARLGEVVGDSGAIEVDHTMITMPAVAFDAVYVPGGADAAATLTSSSEARLFVAEAFAHAKAIAADEDAATLLKGAGIPVNGAVIDGVVVGDAATIAKPFIAAIGQHRAWGRSELQPIPA
jgi:catalase